MSFDVTEQAIPQGAETGSNSIHRKFGIFLRDLELGRRAGSQTCGCGRTISANKKQCFACSTTPRP